MPGRKRRLSAAAEGGQCNCTALRKASRRISLLYDSALAESGLKATQRAILAQVRRSEPTAVGALAEALVMDPGALAHTLKPLERDDLVAVGIDPRDRRNRSITLTTKGRAKLAQSDVLWERAQHGFETACGQVSSEDLRAALRLLISDDFALAFEGGLASPTLEVGGRR